MSKLVISSDLHLGHNNICKYRTDFSSAEEHHQIIFDNLAKSVNKADSLWLLGDVAFTKEWLNSLKSINCRRKVLIMGNHDCERGINYKDMVNVYDAVFGITSHRNCWFSHAPIHETEIRSRIMNVHGHTHQFLVGDPRYVNVCVDQTEYKPVTFADLEDLRRKQNGL